MVDFGLGFFDWLILQFNENIGGQDMRRDRFLSLTIDATKKCNRGCTHCLSCATMQKEKRFKTRWAKKLAKQAKQLAYFLNVTFTGGGEILLNARLYELISAICSRGNCRKLAIVTSGFQNERERHLFRRILNRSFGHKIEYLLSFNLYSKEFPKRLQDTLREIILHRRTVLATIKMVFDNKNHLETYWKLNDVITKLEVEMGAAFDPVCIDYTDPTYSQFLKEWKSLKDSYSEEDDWFLTCYAVIVRYYYLMRSKHGKTVLNLWPGFIAKQGRAKNNFSDQAFIKTKFECIHVLGIGQIEPKRRRGDAKFVIDEDGTVFMECSCAYVTLSIGNIKKDSMKKLLMRRKILQNNLLRKIIEGNFEGRLSCELCAKVAKANFELD